MDDQLQNNNKTELLTIQKAQLENKKIELEIEQLGQSYFKKSILPTLIHVLITSIIAITSIYFAYHNILTDVKERNIDAKIKSNETLLKTIELTQKRNELNNEIIVFETTRKRLLRDSLSLAHRLDSMGQEILVMQHEKSNLNRNISSLSSHKAQLVNELGFATINYNLQEIKKFPGPDYTITYDLINLLHSKNPYRQRITDSLLQFAKDSNIKYISLFILYRGTANLFYKDELFQAIPGILNQLNEKNTCLSRDFKYLLSDNSWNKKEKHELLNILMKSYNESMSFCGKLGVLSIIMQYGFDSSFSFLKTNYNLYWDYLKINRDLFNSADTLLYEEDRYLILGNIAMYSPQLYFSLLVKYLSQVDNNRDFTTTAGNFALLKSLTSMSHLPIHQQDELFKFGTANNLLSRTTNTQLHYKEYYDRNKNGINRWLHGNFEAFRKDTANAFACMNKQSF